MMFFMLTNSRAQSTTLLCEGQGAEQLIAAAFRNGEDYPQTGNHCVYLPGVVSRKKQLIPAISLAVQS